MRGSCSCCSAERAEEDEETEEAEALIITIANIELCEAAAAAAAAVYCCQTTTRGVILVFTAFATWAPTSPQFTPKLTNLKLARRRRHFISADQLVAINDLTKCWCSSCC